jgi:hypothetical protein
MATADKRLKDIRAGDYKNYGVARRAVKNGSQTIDIDIYFKNTLFSVIESSEIDANISFKQVYRVRTYLIDEKPICFDKLIIYLKNNELATSFRCEYDSIRALNTIMPDCSEKFIYCGYVEYDLTILTNFCC